MAILKGIWFYLVLIFPFCVCIWLSMAASDLVKAYYYDLQKYKLLRELHWISYAKTDVDNRITKDIERNVIQIIVCVALLIAYFLYVDDKGLTFLVIFIMSVYGLSQSSKKNTSMEAFLKKYKIEIQYEELKNNTGTYHN